MLTAFLILVDILNIILVFMFFIKTAKSYYENDTHSMLFNGIMLIVICM